MTKPYEIPRKLVTYNEGDLPPDDAIVKEAESLVYEPRDGELVEVTYWARYPDYDFIFGVPTILNPKHKLEVGFFQFRSAKHAIGREGIYIDVNELIDMIDGFQSMCDRSKSNSANLWFKHDEEKNGGGEKQ